MRVLWHVGNDGDVVASSFDLDKAWEEAAQKGIWMVGRGTDLRFCTTKELRAHGWSAWGIQTVDEPIDK